MREQPTEAPAPKELSGGTSPKGSHNHDMRQHRALFSPRLATSLKPRMAKREGRDTILLNLTLRIPYGNSVSRRRRWRDYISRAVPALTVTPVAEVTEKKV